MHLELRDFDASFPPAERWDWRSRDLIFAAVWVGRPVQHPASSRQLAGPVRASDLSELELREIGGTFDVLSTYIEDDDGEVRATSHFRRSMSETDRVAATGKLGMGAAALVATRLGAPVVVHAEVLEARRSLTVKNVWSTKSSKYVPTRSRPDLLGYIPGNGWLTVEAKGTRLNGADAESQLAKGKRQADVVQGVSRDANGFYPPAGMPVLKVASQLRMADELRIVAVDPPEDPPLGAFQRARAWLDYATGRRLRLEVDWATTVVDSLRLPYQLRERNPESMLPNGGHHVVELNDRWALALRNDVLNVYAEYLEAIRPDVAPVAHTLVTATYARRILEKLGTPGDSIRSAGAAEINGVRVVRLDD